MAQKAENADGFSTTMDYDAWYPISFKIAIPEGKEILLAVGSHD